MTDPLDSNDDWAELARELERDKPPAPADMVERQIEAEEVEPHHNDPRAEDEAVAEGESADEEFDDADEGGPVEAGDATAEGEQPGTGRKRRRRRRRRRKGGAPAEGAVSAAALSEAGGDEGEAAPVAEVEDEAPGEPVADGDFDDALDEVDVEPAAPALVDEEDTATEALCDLIANWNVPSWDEIVGGLYRPN